MKWQTTLRRLIPELKNLYVDEVRPAHLIALRTKMARWMRDGVPSTHPRDKGTGKLVHLAPVTANGWITILKVICRAMTKYFELELEHDPSEVIEKFPVPRTYTREQPNALTPAQAAAFLAKMKELYPQHYAMTLLGFAIGSRPSTMRPIRRRGASADVLWEQGILLIRRSNSLGREIMDETKTALDQELRLPPAVIAALKEHVAALEDEMALSDYLFPSVTGGLRARSVLDKPFRAVLKALKWEVRLTRGVCVARSRTSRGRRTCAT